MIKSVPAHAAKNVKINLFLKDGREFLGCDVPEQPFGQHERFVGIWHENAIRTFPLSEVKEVVMYFETNL